jgi:hypothetical protein
MMASDRHSLSAHDDEALLLAADIIGLLLRRLDVSANAADALELLRATLAARGERRIRPNELHRNLHGIYGALSRIRRDAPPGTFEEAFERVTAE